MSKSPVSPCFLLPLLLAGACLLLPSPALGQETKQETPEAPTEAASEPTGQATGQAPSESEIQELLRSGIQSYEQGEFQAAIETFSRVLALDPDNALALYERALAHAAVQDHDACVTDVQAGLELDSPWKAGLFAAGGTCLSASGQTMEALRMFRRGLSRFPDDTDLHFNIAITLGNHGQEAEAASHLESLLRREPDHPTANFVLASIYHAGGQRVAAVFQYLRFLAVEPTSPRSAAAASAFLELFNRGIEKTEDHKYQVSVPANGGTDLFRDLNLGLTLLAGATKTEEYQQIPYAAQIAEVVGSLVVLAQESPNLALRGTFVWKHAIEYLIDMQEAEVLRTFGFVAFSQLKLEGADIWFSANREAVKSFSDWRKAQLGKS